jgi:hypothetical protein
MNVTILVLNEDGELHFKSEDPIEVDKLIESSKDTVQLVREKGAQWAADALPFFAGEVVDAVNTGEHRDVSTAIFQLVKAAWLFDSLYGGITASQYFESDIEFIIAASGAISFKRIPAANNTSQTRH